MGAGNPWSLEGGGDRAGNIVGRLPGRGGQGNCAGAEARGLDDGDLATLGARGPRLELQRDPVKLVAQRKAERAQLEAAPGRLARRSRERRRREFTPGGLPTRIGRGR